ncbi:MAG: VCBS repeat-containing protein, partial [Acidobacteriales bacterium]|nr:VCBS repeat-containing protein [Terriglobales bacterium]
NGDGQPDFGVIDDNGVTILLRMGDGTFQLAGSFAAGPSPFSLTTGDFNGDGVPDLAVANYTTNGAVSVLLNSCTTSSVDLTMVRSSSTATISWPFPSTGFILESTVSLSPPNWQVAPEVPAPDNGRWRVSVSLDQMQRYFRLRKP